MWRSGLMAALTGVQLEQQLDGEVVEVAAVLDDLDERRQPTLARRQRGDGDGRVELPDHCQTDQGAGHSVERQRGVSLKERLSRESALSLHLTLVCFVRFIQHGSLQKELLVWEISSSAGTFHD